MTRFVLALSALAALTASPALAAPASDEALAEKRLRACLAAGSSTAPRTSLAAAVQSARAFCGPQIGNLAQLRIAAATRGLSRSEAEEAEDDDASEAASSGETPNTRPS